ncbi:MAG: ABC transporter substrate-binding protein [Oscillospiraceae bacterium]|jgi:peptide/nickel transport system substrate-binding protein|nr:ABC transporter substrate-binding protein [Oscillospiraceae bacterium]
MKKAFLILFIVLAVIAVAAAVVFGTGLLTFGEDTGAAASPPLETEEPAASITPPSPSPGPTRAPAVLGDNRFSLRHNPDVSLNPITGTDPDNLRLGSLLYESLFALDERFTAVPVLCESYHTDNGKTFRFTIYEDIAMSDGTTMDAYDVAYSLNRARESSRLSARLSDITSVTVFERLTVEVTLGHVNYRLPTLLDVPIIKYGSTGTVPPGSGPYRYDATGEEPMLVKSIEYRNSSLLPVDVIYLESCTDAELGERFTSQRIDLYEDDPMGGYRVIVPRDHETRYYDTTTLQFLGLNDRVEAMRDPAFRRAIAAAADVRGLAAEIMGGHAVAAPLALSPRHALYNAAWEPKRTGSAFAELSGILAEMGFEDTDSDRYLEYMREDGSHSPFTLTFIVNDDNEFKVAAAERIADVISRVGLDIELKVLPWDEFEAVLKSGGFDMYYGEVRLSADFNLSPLLLPGGSLDYGGMGGEKYRALLADFSAAESEKAQTDAARALCYAVEDDAPFIPLLYKQFAVHTGRNVARGLRPTQSGIFTNITQWQLIIDN